MLPIALLLISFLLLFLPIEYKESFAGITIRIFYAPGKILKEKFEGLYKVKERARELEAELTSAKLKISFYSDASRENARLREFLDFQSSYDFKLIPAEIIKKTDSPHRFSVLINIGNGGKIKPDMTAVSDEGLVGRVQFVFNDYAEVQLLTDPTCRVAAVDTRSRVQGILKPNPSGVLIFDNVPAHENIMVGDTLKSSGLGGVFPPGIPLGVITEINIRSSSYLFAEIVVKPFVDFDRLERFFILGNKEE